MRRTNAVMLSEGFDRVRHGCVDRGPAGKRLDTRRVRRRFRCTEQAVPVIVLEEIMRGRLNIIRQAEAGRASISLARAYELFEDTFTDLQRLHILSYTPQAESLYQEWRQQGIRLATHDLRIAASCVVHAARLISRNRRDFARVPGVSN